MTKIQVLRQFRKSIFYSDPVLFYDRNIGIETVFHAHLIPKIPEQTEVLFYDRDISIETL